MDKKLEGEHRIRREGSGYVVVYYTDYWYPCCGGRAQVVIPLKRYEGRGAKNRASKYLEEITAPNGVLSRRPQAAKRTPTFRGRLENGVRCDMKIDEAFEKFVKVKETKIGATADCCLGLWGVSGPSKEEVLRQARHYFVQYWSDGEYDHLINT